jgi:hypothetical protein
MRGLHDSSRASCILHYKSSVTFVGLNFEEAASALGIAVPTAKQWWAYARASPSSFFLEKSTARNLQTGPCNYSNPKDNQSNR